MQRMGEEAYFPAQGRELQRRDAIFFHLPEQTERFDVNPYFAYNLQSSDKNIAQINRNSRE